MTGIQTRTARVHPELAEYLQCIDPDDLGNLDAVEASWLEAQRIMSPQGLENYLVGIKAMCTLGKGQDLVMTGCEARMRTLALSRATRSSALPRFVLPQ